MPNDGAVTSANPSNDFAGLPATGPSLKQPAGRSFGSPQRPSLEYATPNPTRRSPSTTLATDSRPPVAGAMSGASTARNVPISTDLPSGEGRTRGLRVESQPPGTCQISGIEAAMIRGGVPPKSWLMAG